MNTIGTKTNRDGIGATIHLVLPDGMEQYATVRTAVGYLSSSDKRVHFGLGAHASAKLLEISWPSGISQKLEDVRADQLLTVREPYPTGICQMKLSAAILVAATTLCSAQIGIEKLIPKAQVDLSQGKLDLAEGEARQALANNEDIPEAHNILGLIAERRRRLPRPKTNSGSPEN